MTKYTKEYLIDVASKTNFIKDNLEKVLRLSKILEYINKDDFLKDKLALKGGTAINLTIFDIPRLSVDIDLDLTINIQKDELVIIRNKIEEKITQYMINEGYQLKVTNVNRYALLSLIFSYINNAGNKDNIKIEINLMDRCHILPLVHRNVNLRGIIEPISVLTLHKIELFASKINALLSRSVPRDLYDVFSMFESNTIDDYKLLKKCLVFYDMVGGKQIIDQLDYSTIKNMGFMKYKTQLKPVISKNDKFNIEEAKTYVIDRLTEILKFDENELEFIAKFKEKHYDPFLLFNDSEIVDRIKNHPMALFRCK